MLHDLSEHELRIHHGRCFNNWQYVSDSKECGCFYCLRHFDADEITHWYESPNEKSATCPYCYMDSVIIETEREHVEHDLLCQLNMRFFNTAPIEWCEKSVPVDRICIDSYEKFLSEVFSKIYNEHRPYGREKSRYYKEPWNNPKSSRLLQSLILRV